jgi:hypothetical protein
MIQCPQCGNSTEFDIEAAVAWRTVFITQTADDIAHGGFQKGRFDKDWADYDPYNERMLGEWDDLTECTCMRGRDDMDDDSGSYGCGYGGPLHTFYVEKLKAVAPKDAGVEEADHAG